MTETPLSGLISVGVDLAFIEQFGTEPRCETLQLTTQFLVAGELVRMEGSPAEDVSLDAALDLVPRLENRRAGFDGPDTTFDLFGPLGFCVGVRGAVEAREQLRGEFGTGLFVEAQCVGQNCCGRLGHDESILRPGRLPNKR